MGVCFAGDKTGRAPFGKRPGRAARSFWARGTISEQLFSIRDRKIKNLYLMNRSRKNSEEFASTLWKSPRMG